MNWTSAQLETIETRDKNILVSAAAGSGKTTVLIERIKQLVLRDRIDLDRFLITTFTNAAAQEMKEKMERAIVGELERLEDEPEIEERRSKEAFLQRQLNLLPQSNISTFHTFTLSIMRDFFYLTDLQPGFAVGDEIRLSIMRRQAVDRMFERRFEEEAEELGAFLRKHSGDRSDEQLKKDILKIYEQMRSIPRYMQWAQETNDLLGGEDPMKDLGIGAFVIREAEETFGDACSRLGAAVRILDTTQTQGLCQKARQDAERIAEIAEDIETRRGEPVETRYNDIRGQLEELSYNQMRAGKDEKQAFEAVKERVNDFRDQGKKALKQLRERLFAFEWEENNEILRDGAADAAYFIGMVRETEEIYREMKQEQNMVDFDDCMHYAIEILSDEAAASEYRERFRYIFIDEYQDSNLLQEEIIGRIANENNLFMVGDIKQSIYKFRLAEPEIFRDRYLRYRDGEAPQSMRIDLNSNFRSRKTIRDAVNRIFEPIMEGYDEDARLHGMEDPAHPGEPVCLYIIDKSGEHVPDDGGEPEVIESIIRQSLKKTVFEDGAERPITFGDIAVLARTGTNIPQIERYLNNAGIPARGVTAGGYYETVEIQVFLNLLKVISNLRQDVPLISVMSSVVFDFTPTDLARIRIACRTGSFCGAVADYAENGEDAALAAKIRRMLEQISVWKEMGRTVPLDELMRTLLYDTGYYDYCSGLPAGHQRISNLRLLLEKAAAFEQTSHMGLFGFLSYVEEMKSSKKDETEAPVGGEGEDAVHIMTVHKSKGLEFPVVILAEAGKDIRGSSEGKSPSLHKKFTIALPQVNTEQRWKRRTILQRAIAAMKAREDLDEEIRILYVALTRPKEELAITAAVKDTEKLPDFPDCKSFVNMVYYTLKEMEAEDPAAAQVVMCDFSGSEEDDELLAEAFAEDPATETAANPGGAYASADPAEIARRLSFRYPYEQQGRIKSKYSVTELNRMSDGSTRTLQRQIPPLRSMQEETRAMTAAETGTVMHAIMERIDFARAGREGLPYISDFIEQLRTAEILTEEEYNAADPRAVARFFSTETGRRAASTPELYREREFILQKEIDGVPVVVQGVIDCYFRDSGGLVLIDYKNSWASGPEGEQELIERYSGQIRLYREALEYAEGQPVAESWLYLFRSGNFISID